MLTGLSSALAGVSLWKEQRGLKAQAMEGEAAETKRPLGRQSETSLSPILFPSLTLRNTLTVSGASFTHVTGLSMLLTSMKLFKRRCCST